MNAEQHCRQHINANEKEKDRAWHERDVHS